MWLVPKIISSNKNASWRSCASDSHQFLRRQNSNKWRCCSAAISQAWLNLIDLSTDLRQMSLASFCMFVMSGLDNLASDFHKLDEFDSLLLIICLLTCALVNHGLDQPWTESVWASIHQIKSLFLHYTHKMLGDGVCFHVAGFVHDLLCCAHVADCCEHAAGCCAHVHIMNAMEWRIGIANVADYEQLWKGQRQVVLVSVVVRLIMCLQYTNILCWGPRFFKIWYSTCPQQHLQ